MNKNKSDSLKRAALFVLATSAATAAVVITCQPGKSVLKHCK
jgi:hypothetical protein